MKTLNTFAAAALVMATTIVGAANAQDQSQQGDAWNGWMGMMAPRHDGLQRPRIMDDGATRFQSGDVQCDGQSYRRPSRVRQGGVKNNVTSGTLSHSGS